MAQAPQNPKNDGTDFVRHIVADPKNVPDVMLLYGYLGDSSEDGHERLYLSPDLSAYVEVPKDAILHQAAAAKESDPHGGVTLWVKKGAALQYKMAPAQQAVAHFFAGAIQAQAGGGAQAFGYPGGGIQPTPTAHVTVACPTHFAICTRLPICGASEVTCGGPVCHRSIAAALCPVAQAQPAAAPAGPALQGNSFVDCSIICPSHVLVCHHTIPPQATCGFVCLPTINQPACHVTRGQPQCPLPTEVTCGPICNASPAPACAPSAGIACSIACGYGQQGGGVVEAARLCALGTLHPTTTVLPTHIPIECSIVCPTHAVTCNIACLPTRPVVCPVVTAAACPPYTPACAQQGQAQVEQFAQAARPAAVNVTDWSFRPGCWYSYDACPTMVCPHLPPRSFNCPQ